MALSEIKGLNQGNKENETIDKFQNIEAFIFCQRFQIIDQIEISAICDRVLTSFLVNESQN